jgi:hypothetical protein
MDLEYETGSGPTVRVTENRARLSPVRLNT